MTARPIRSDDLLGLGQRFVPSNAPPGRPRAAHLRRGVSLAYYALFHELFDMSTSELCGRAPAQVSPRREVARWFTHTDLRMLAEATANAGSGGLGRAMAGVLDQPHADLVWVAEAFCMLQGARHRADYDHGYKLTREDATGLVERAAAAIGRLRRLRQDRDPSLHLFLRLMVGAVKIARNRQP